MQTNCSTLWSRTIPRWRMRRPLRIRRARPDESRLLPRLERSKRGGANPFFRRRASLSGHRVARAGGACCDRPIHAYLLEVRDSPVGYVAFDGDTVHHLGVVPDHHNGADTALRAGVRVRRSTPAVPGRRSVGCWSRITPHAPFAPAAWMRPASGEGRSTRRILDHCR